MKKILSIVAVLFIVACSSMTPAEREVANLAKISKNSEKKKNQLEKENAELKKSNEELITANKVLKRYIEEMKK